MPVVIKSPHIQWIDGRVVMQYVGFDSLAVLS